MSTPSPSPTPAQAPAAAPAPAGAPAAAPAAEPALGADAAAAQMLANAIAAARQQPQPAAANPAGTPAAPAPAGEPEVTDWEAEAAKWKAMSRKHEAGQLTALGLKSRDELDALRDAAGKYAEFQDQQKSELQRATERAVSIEQQLAEQRSVNSRLMAAATHSIPPDLIDLLGTGTDEEINTRAAALAERLKAVTPSAIPAAPALPAPQRPIEALTPGAAPASTPPADPDAWIRRAAGRTP